MPQAASCLEVTFSRWPQLHAAGLSCLVSLKIGSWLGPTCTCCRCQQNALEVAADRIRQQMKKAQEQSKRAARMARRTEPATASAVAAPAAAAASAGSAEERDADVCGEGPLAVGWQLSVLWPDDQQMYLGRVTAWCSKHNFHLVTYNDGEPVGLPWNSVMQQPTPAMHYAP